MTIEGVPELSARVLTVHDDGGPLRVGGWDRAHRARLFPATPRDVRVLDACDGARRVPELARMAGLPAAEVEAILARWDDRIGGSFVWRAAPRGAAGVEDFAREMLREVRAVEGLASAPDARAYHADRIEDAERQFDQVETTVSHAYGVPHPGLHGRSYGEAFFDRCVALGAVRPGLRVLEIGCGTGRFARAFLDRFDRSQPHAYLTARYTMFDLAPRLAESQRVHTARHASRVDFERGDVEAHPFGRPFDLVIANEMMADLSVALVDAGRPRETPCVARYDLDLRGALRQSLVNSGAIRLLEQIGGVLAPGGHALVTEYGSRDAFPVAVRLGDHIEHSIHFGHLEQVAGALGLGHACEPLDAFLGFDAAALVIAHDSMALLAALSRELFSMELARLAYTEEQLRVVVGERLARIEGLRFLPIADPRSFLSPRVFQALHLRREPASRPEARR